MSLTLIAVRGLLLKSALPMKFTDQEKISIVSLLIEMANADGRVAYEEMITFNLLCQQLKIDHNAFVVGHGLKCDHAVEVLKSMSASKKLDLAQMLVQIIDSDNKVAPAEISLLEHLGKQLGIDQLLNE